MAVTLNVSQLGPELRRKRSEAGLSLKDVEDLTEISAATLSRIERGSNPDTAIIGKLAAWLGVNVRTGGKSSDNVRSDDDLKRTIAVHLRANKKLSEELARSIADSFELVMRVEMQKARKG